MDPRVWLFQVFMVVLGTVTCNFFLMRLIGFLETLVASTASLWDDSLLSAARLPTRLFVWTIGLTLAASILESVTKSFLFSYIPDIRKVGYIFILTLFITRFINCVEERLIARGLNDKNLDPTTAKATGKILRLSVTITAVLIAMQTMGYSVSGVLAFGGVGGVAMGFAAKDLLANFFGGLMLYWDKPFAVGDWVRSPDRDIEGHVEDIGWRLTRILTFDKRPLYIPNSMFSSIVVENPSRMSNRRIYENIGIRYDDAPVLQDICAAIRLMLRQHSEIEPELTQIVHFNSYGSSHLEIMVYAFTKTTDWKTFHRVKEDVLIHIMKIVQNHGAEFAFPTQTLHIASVPQVDFKKV